MNTMNHWTAEHNLKGQQHEDCKLTIYCYNYSNGPILFYLRISPPVADQRDLNFDRACSASDDGNQYGSIPNAPTRPPLRFGSTSGYKSFPIDASGESTASHTIGAPNILASVSIPSPSFSDATIGTDPHSGVTDMVDSSRPLKGLAARKTNQATPSHFPSTGCTASTACLGPCNALNTHEPFQRILGPTNAFGAPTSIRPFSTSFGSYSAFYPPSFPITNGALNNDLVRHPPHLAPPNGTYCSPNYHAPPAFAERLDSKARTSPYEATGVDPSISSIASETFYRRAKFAPFDQNQLTHHLSNDQQTFTDSESSSASFRLHSDRSASLLAGTPLSEPQFEPDTQQSQSPQLCSNCKTVIRPSKKKPLQRNGIHAKYTDEIQGRLSSKDAFLVESKAAGMSYREIQERGKFTEAESTLRGRYRNITKEKNRRVRRPMWTQLDVRYTTVLLHQKTNVQKLELLNEGVDKLARKKVKSFKKNRKLQRQPGADLKIPWGKVAEYVVDQGSSYEFGNSTCRKKWEEINTCKEEVSES